MSDSSSQMSQESELSQDGDNDKHFPWLEDFQAQLRTLSLNMGKDEYFKLLKKFQGIVSVEAMKLRQKPIRATKFSQTMKRLVGKLKLIAISTKWDRKSELRILPALGLILSHYINLINASTMKSRKPTEAVASDLYVFVKLILEGREDFVLDTFLCSNIVEDTTKQNSLGYFVLLKIIQEERIYTYENESFIKFLTILKLFQECEGEGAKKIINKVLLRIKSYPTGFHGFVQRKLDINVPPLDDMDLRIVLNQIKTVKLIKFSKERLALQTWDTRKDSGKYNSSEEVCEKFFFDTQGYTSQTQEQEIAKLEEAYNSQKIKPDSGSDVDGLSLHSWDTHEYSVQLDDSKDGQEVCQKLSLTQVHTSYDKASSETQVQVNGKSEHVHKTVKIKPGSDLERKKLPRVEDTSLGSICLDVSGGSEELYQKIFLDSLSYSCYDDPKTETQEKKGEKSKQINKSQQIEPCSDSERKKLLSFDNLDIHQNLMELHDSNQEDTCRKLFLDFKEYSCYDQISEGGQLEEIVKLERVNKIANMKLDSDSDSSIQEVYSALPAIPGESDTDDSPVERDEASSDSDADHFRSPESSESESETENGISSKGIMFTTSNRMNDQKIAIDEQLEDLETETESENGISSQDQDVTLNNGSDTNDQDKLVNLETETESEDDISSEYDTSNKLDNKNTVVEGELENHEAESKDEISFKYSTLTKVNDAKTAVSIEAELEDLERKTEQSGDQISSEDIILKKVNDANSGISTEVELENFDDEHETPLKRPRISDDTLEIIAANIGENTLSLADNKYKINVQPSSITSKSPARPQKIATKSVELAGPTWNLRARPQQGHTQNVVGPTKTVKSSSQEISPETYAISRRTVGAQIKQKATERIEASARILRTRPQQSPSQSVMVSRRTVKAQPKQSATKSVVNSSSAVEAQPKLITPEVTLAATRTVKGRPKPRATKLIAVTTGTVKVKGRPEPSVAKDVAVSPNTVKGRGGPSQNATKTVAVPTRTLRKRSRP